MKKCSTAIAGAAGLYRRATSGIALCMAACTAPSASAATGLVAPTKPACQFSDDAPEQLIVTAGDTLWDLASRLLRDPWCWPEMWTRNRDTITNPHLIYPGQRIWLDRARGRLLTDQSDATALPTVKLSPQVRAHAIEVAPLPLINAAWRSLLQLAPLISAADTADAAQVVGMASDRRMAAAGDLIYVGGQLVPADEQMLLRPLAPVIDPDTGQSIAIVTRRVGRARVQPAPVGEDAPQLVQVTEARMEIMRGDLLLPVRLDELALAAIEPHPAPALQGRVAAVLHEGRWASLHDIVVINRGAQHGLDTGSLVVVARPVRIVAHASSPSVSRPTSRSESEIDETIALLLVVRVLDHASLAIVMRSIEPFSSGAPLRSPLDASISSPPRSPLSSPIKSPLMPANASEPKSLEPK